MGFWIKTAFLFLMRSGRTTAVLSLMVVTAVATLIFLSALAVGVNDAMIRNSVGIYPGHITGFALSPGLGREDLLVDGVAGVLKRVYLTGIASRGNRFETVALVGVDQEEEVKHTAIWKKTAQGRYLRKGEAGVVIGQLLAERLHVGPGDSFDFSPSPGAAGTRFGVVGVFRTGIDQFDRGLAFCPSDRLPADPGTWSAAVFLKDGVDADAIIATYRRTLPESPSFKSWAELMPDLKQLIDLNYVSMSLVTILVFGVVSLGIACAFAIFILKNLREYGIMKTMGVAPGEMAFFIVMEVFLMNLVASGIGVIIGVLAVLIVAKTGIDLAAYTSYNRYFAVSAVIYPRLTAYSLGLPPALAFVFSLAAAIWPAMLVARKKAAHILRMV